MKTLATGLLVSSLLLSVGCQQRPGEKSEQEALAGTVTMSGAWALYPMAVKWGEEFQKRHPEVRIDVAAGGAGKGMADALAQVVDIGMVSRDVYEQEINKGAWWVSVTEDAVVPTLNESNPLLQDILSKGAKRETFVGIWITTAVRDWKDVVPVTKEVVGRTALHVYTRSDACGAAETWAGFLGKKQEDLQGVGVYGDPGLAEAVKKDGLGIGYNNINYVYDSKTKGQLKGLRVLPIDLNANGRIDEDEDFYGSRDDVVKAIAAGKYPSPPARDLHFVSQGKPKRKVVREFIKWVLTEGQKYVPEAGYINLTDEKLQAGLRELDGE